MSGTREIARLSAREIQNHVTKSSILVQPLGATEQHGPHLPLATDSLIARAVATAGVERAAANGLDVWLLPTFEYTKSNEHAWSPGTVWLSAATLQAVLLDVGRSVASTPCRKLVFFNGHGGNSALTAMMNRELRLAHGLMTFLAHPSLPPDQGGDSAADEWGMGIHGGHDETSLMLHLHPELVNMVLARRAIPDRLLDNTHVKFGGSVQFGWLSNDFDSSGVIGDPRGANADRGKEAFETAVESFVGALIEIDRFELPA